MASFSYEKARLAELVAESCRILGTLDMTIGALGHVSCRLDGGNTMLIKGKGEDEAALRYTKASDILEIDFDAEVVEVRAASRLPKRAPSTRLYRAHPEVQSVIHCHPEYAVLMTICEKEIIPVYRAARAGGELAVAGIPTYPRAHTITNQETAQQFVRVMGSSKVALMRGHGITVYGSSVEDATVRSLSFDELVRFNYKAYLLGNPKPVPPEDIEYLRNYKASDSQIQSYWRYYSRLANNDCSH